MAESQPHADEAAHGQSDKMARKNAKGAYKAGSIFCQSLHVITGPRHLAATLATEIKGNAAIAFLECRDLGIEHSAAPEQPVSKDDRLQPAAMLFIKEASAVD